MTGLSGSGKTLLARLYAKALIQGGLDGQLFTLPVQPGWHDPGALLGFTNPLRTDSYVRTPFLEFLLAAAADLTHPFIVVLDEMNLSHPEQYMAPLLSAMETGDAVRLHTEGEMLHTYLVKIQAELLPKSEAGQAVAYILKNWMALTRHSADPDLPIDNNHTERSLRGWAVGRNNWTFFGSDRGRRTAAVLRSFVASCETVKVDPFAWFRDVLSRIANCSITKLDELLPHRWVPAHTP